MNRIWTPKWVAVFKLVLIDIRQLNAIRRACKMYSDGTITRVIKFFPWWSTHFTVSCIVCKSLLWHRMACVCVFFPPFVRFLFHFIQYTLIELFFFWCLRCSAYNTLLLIKAIFIHILCSVFHLIWWSLCMAKCEDASQQSHFRHTQTNVQVPRVLEN